MKFAVSLLEVLLQRLCWMDEQEAMDEERGGTHRGIDGETRASKPVLVKGAVTVQAANTSGWKNEEKRAAWWWLALADMKFQQGRFLEALQLYLKVSSRVCIQNVPPFGFLVLVLAFRQLHCFAC